MTAKKETLADYLQRQETLRNANKYQGLSQSQKQRIEYFDAKKKKVGVLLSDILYQVKKSISNQESYTKLQKMIKAAAEEIKTQFQNTNKFTQQKMKDQLNEIQTRLDLSSISINSKISQKESDLNVLKEVNKTNQISSKQESEKAKTNQGKQYSRAKQNSKISDVKSRSFLPQGR